jgi:aryl-alcohol dehydrogenase-like predicted oxidoreductase
MIADGKALYWGTSEWSAAEIRAAWEIAERHHLHKPVMEQPQYHLLHRKPASSRNTPGSTRTCGLGLTTWSPLASGLLTGKYRQGIPEGSRGAMENMAFLREGLTSPARNAVVEQLAPIAQELGGSLAQLAIAWATMNPRVSTVILGASRASQLQENLGALALRERLTPELMARIEAISSPLAS